MPQKKAYDPLLLTSKTVFLMRVQEAVSDGYSCFTTGSVPLEKMQRLARKFKNLYSVHLDKNARYLRKKEGLGNARLVMRLNEEASVDFVLLVTPGDHPAHQLEKLGDFRSEPLAYRELELLRLTLAGRARPSITWRLNAEAMKAWKERLHLITARNDTLEIFRGWHSLYRTPGFGGVRRQVGQLVSFWRAEWRRLRRDERCPMALPHNDIAFRPRPAVTKEDGMYWTARGFPTPAQLPKLFYVRKQANVGVRLSKALAEVKSTSSSISDSGDMPVTAQ